MSTSPSASRPGSGQITMDDDCAALGATSTATPAAVEAATITVTAERATTTDHPQGSTLMPSESSELENSLVDPAFVDDSGSEHLDEDISETAGHPDGGNENPQTGHEDFTAVVEGEDSTGTLAAAIQQEERKVSISASGTDAPPTTAVVPDACITTEDSQGKTDTADKAGRTSKGEQGKKDDGNRSDLDRITPERVRELIEVGSATQENFRELICFVGWRLSSPYCVSRSFALCSPPPLGGVPPPRKTAAPASAGSSSYAGAGRLTTTPEEPGGQREQKSSLLSSDARQSIVGGNDEEDDDGDCDGVAAATAAFAALKLVGPEEETPPTSSSSTAAAPPQSSSKEQAPAATALSEGPTFVRKEEPPSALTDDPCREREWTDRSSVGMNVKAASEVWKLLVQLDEESVHNTVLNALDSLMQGLLVATFLDRDLSAGAGGEASNVAAAVAAIDGANDEGGSGDSGGGRDTKENENEKAEMRCILLVLEHPEIQDPDFEAVLHTLFKLAMRLPAKRRDELCSFFVGVEDQRFARYLGAVQQFVTLRLFVGGCSASVLPAVQFMHLLYLANQKSRKVKDEAFYNEAINSELMAHRPTLVDNYIEWRQDHHQSSPAQFKSLISFGEVLDPASKSAVLSLDSEVQMRGTISNELQEAMFGGIGDFGATVSPYLKLTVRRSHIVADSLLALVMLAEEDLKKPLKVTFVGEEGVDEGGVQKEYFQVMLRELLDPKYSMLKYDEETRRLWFNSDSLEAQEEFELVGMLLGIAIYNGIILDVPFPLVVYKLVVGGTPTLEDLKEAQPVVGRGLQQLLDFDGDVESTFSRTFQISYEVFGAVKTFDLKEEGGETAVTKDNRQEYVDLYVNWLLVESVKGQYGPFERGFHKVVGGKALSLFRPEELELLICGNPKLDFSALEENSEYQDGYSRDNAVVKNFWEVVHEFGEDSKRKLLKFATGSDRAPIQGLGSSALSLVISKNGGDSDRLPTAHTCFNHLLLPSYSTKGKLRDRLNLAIEQSEGFGLR